MDGNPRKTMLFGSVSIASMAMLIVGSMVPSVYLNTATDKTLNESNILENWNIIVPDDFSTLQDAVDNAKSGDRIFVRSGRYNSGTGFFDNPLIIRTSDITLFGEDKNTTFIDGRYQSTVIYIYADSVKIQGFTIKNNGLNSSLLSIHSSHNIIENNTFKTHDVYDGIEYGIRFYNAHYNLFSYNHVSYGEHGIDLLNADNNVFSYNLVENTDYAIDIDDILTVNFSRPSTDKIYRKSCCNNQFIGNIIQNNMRGITLSVSPDNLFLNNTFISNSRNGLTLTSCTNNKIKSNKFIDDGLGLFGDEIDYYIHDIQDNLVNDKPLYYMYDQNNFDVPSDAGQIILVDCSSVSIEEVIISNTSTAVLVVFSEHVYIKNCEFSSNTRGVYLYFSTRCSIEKNNFIDNRRNAYFINLGFLNSRSNTWSRNYWENILDLKIGLFRPLREKIHGRFILKKTIRLYKGPQLGIRTRNIDRFPARNSYEI